MIGVSYTGDLDDLAIFNRVLTSNQVQRIYKLKRGIRELSARKKQRQIDRR